MSQNQYPPISGKTNIYAALLVCEMLIVRKGKQEGVVENRFALFEVHFVLP